MTAILDERTPPSAIEALCRLGHEVILLPPASGLPAPVASHPDMLLFFANDAIFCTESYLSSAKDLLCRISLAANLPLRTIAADYGNPYPKDVPLNALPLGDRLFCNPSTVAREILCHPSYRALNVRQGYTKCATLPVGKNALISSDPSILSVAVSHGIDTLKISAGHIRIRGYDYGFIGGCTSLAPYKDIRQIYFCGDLQKHPDGKGIEEFCRARGIEPISLCEETLTDVGTMFLI